MPYERMKLEDQVCSLELANRLQKLNVEQESWLVWAQGISRRVGLFERRRCFLPKQVAAFTVAELGEIIACGMAKKRPRVWFPLPQLDTLLGKWTSINKSLDADTEADARAKMLAYLMENRLITL